MEKIQTLEQLDKVGTKICELLNVSIDKANIIIPETMQQYINYTICIDSVLLTIMTIILILIGIHIKKCFNSPELGDPIIAGLIAGFEMMATTAVIIAYVVLFAELLKAFIAPNMLIIEKFSQLVM